MKNISFQCLPPSYLVPKKFHCVIAPAVGEESTRLELPTLTNKLNICDKEFGSNVKVEKCWSTNENESPQSLVKNEIMFKKCTVNSSKLFRDRTSAVDKPVSPPIHIVCKSSQSERITQFQLITSNKLENLKSEDNDLKWCPVDFYECPRQPFRRNSFLMITYKEPHLKRLLLNDNHSFKKRNPSLSLTSLNINYEVFSVTEGFITIKSVVDLGIDKPFLQFIECNNNEAEWEEILKLVGSQLGENIKQVHVQIEVDRKKK